jgi:hypothetical protein
MYFIKEGFVFLTLKIYMKTTLENFTQKMCYDYFQAYDITLICSLFVKILYFNYMLYYKKRIGDIIKNCIKQMSYVEWTIIYK